MRIVTYHSLNARPGHEWVAYIDNGGEYLPVRFRGTTEAAAAGAAQAEWDKHEPERLAKAEKRAKAGTVVTPTLASLLPPLPAPNPLAGLLPR